MVLSLFLVTNGPTPDGVYFYSMCMKGCASLHLPQTSIDDIGPYWNCIYSCRLWLI